MATPTEEEYLEALNVKNEYERVQAEIQQAKRTAYHADLKPFVEGDTYAVFHNALLSIKERNQPDNMFNYNVETLITNLLTLAERVAAYAPPIPANLMPAPLPLTPEAEGNTDGE
ncbi:hypothetical protein [Sphingomonas sp. R1]|uniref:hypothetical protein n=1 Tax=Sphingomonas sp. R1 TaxID=399176 RepID=UPI002224587A|nr:hypothetical protein [Sphingomonas sp. R1]UYY77486.1 hypothetical protein OIM94_00285 [Sphingomonas sp. R1]